MADEMFVMLGWVWDVDAATALAARYRVHHGDLRVLGWPRSVIGSIPPLVADGWHRIHRAWVTGVTVLPVVVLDEADDCACRLRGGDR